MKFELIEVSGESCANCFSLLPLVKKLAAERGIAVKHIEVNERSREEVQALQIERVPTLVVLGEGKEIARCTGFQPEEILSLWLDAKLEEAENTYGRK